MKILCNNPYFDKTYFTERTVKEWLDFLANYQRGNEDIFIFADNERNVITINPKNFASVEVTE